MSDHAPLRGGDSAGFTSELEDLRARLEELRSVTARDPGLLVQDLGTAYEELRVADEEIRTQQQHIRGLLDEHERLSQQHERLVAFVPVAMLTTDRHGAIRSANAAASALLGVGPARLLHKPVSAFVRPEDRPALRAALARQVPAGHDLEHSLTLLPRPGGEVPVEVLVSRLPGAAGELSWLLLAGTDLNGPDAESARRLPGVLVRLAALAAEVREVHLLLPEATRLCEEALGGGTVVSAALGDPAEPDVVAAASSLAALADGAQMTAGEGPCRTAHGSAGMVQAADLRSDPRWPRLAERLPEPVQGAVCAPLVVGEEVAGTLNVYTSSRPVTEALVDSVGLLAAAVGTTVQELQMDRQLEDVARQLEEALASRAVIDQAKGIVMAHRRCSAEQAFQHLVDLSSSSHVKLRDVAGRIVANVTDEEARRPGAAGPRPGA